MVVDDANDLLDIDLPSGAWDTVGGLLFDHLGHVPSEGESVDVHGVLLVADRVQGAAHRAGRASWPPTTAGPRRTDERVSLGFAAVIGRPNVGKSTLVNRIVGTKVTITSPRPNTTRTQVRGVLHRPGAQVVFVDTPGLHRPRSQLGRAPERGRGGPASRTSTPSWPWSRPPRPWVRATAWSSPGGCAGPGRPDARRGRTRGPTGWRWS